jgi:hypothetical protein
MALGSGRTEFQLPAQRPNADWEALCITESFRTYRQIGTPRDRLSLIDSLPSQAVRRGPERFVDDRRYGRFRLTAVAIRLIFVANS